MDHPPRKTRVAGIHGRNSHGEAGKEHSDIPPHGYLLVHLHLGKMWVVGLTSAVLLNDLDDLLSVPEQHMGDGGANRHVPANLGHDLGGREPRETNLRKLLLIEQEVLVEDGALVEGCAIEVEQLLREEREVLSLPDVEVVDNAERDAKAQQMIRADTSTPGMRETHMQIMVPK